jgi:hypothetical protein
MSNRSFRRATVFAVLSLSSLAWSQRGQPESLLRVLSEDFQAGTQRELRSTSADWADAFPGALRPGRGGGYGVHGDLRVESGTVVIDVADILPPSQTRFGVPLGPIGDAFYFSSIYVAPGATLRFVGAHGARIYTASLDVRGTLDVSGEDAPLHAPKNDPCPLSTLFPWISNDIGRGGLGGRGGPGGGAGGSGGDDPRPIAPSPSGMPANSGSTARLAPQHIDGENGGGPGAGFGSGAFPATAIDPSFAVRLANVQIQPALLYSLQRAAGAGGGSFGSIGNPGMQEPPFTNNAGSGGPRPSFDPTLPPAIAFGGSGGGGGGVHCYFTNRIASRFPNCKPSYPVGQRPTIGGQQIIEVWNTGAGGGGGGGYLYVQCSELDLDGSLQARGGRGGSSSAFGMTTPGTEAGSGGGGGSGGGIRLDVLRRANLLGTARIDVNGGAGGRSSLNIHGGDGGHGVVHVRSASGGGAFASVVQPAAALGTAALQPSDSHPFSFATSRYYRSQVGRPVQRIIDSIVTFAITRDGAPSPVDPTDPRHVFTVGVPGSLLVHLGPAYVSYQAAQDDGNGNPVPGTETLWTADPSALDPAKTLVRFTLLLDRNWFDPLGPVAGIVGFELYAL